MVQRNLLFVFICCNLLSSTFSITFSSVNDQERYLSTVDLKNIQKNIKQIENYKKYQLTLFITSSFARFKDSSRLQSYMDVTNIERLSEDLYEEMY